MRNQSVNARVWAVTAVLIVWASTPSHGAAKPTDVVGAAAEGWVYAYPMAPDVEAADRWFTQAILTSPALFRRTVGSGALDWLGTRDKGRAFLNGGKTYRLTVPQPVPAASFCSVTAYDAETRSQVRTDQEKAALRSLSERMVANPDGTVDLYFGPRAPAGREGPWLKTVPGRWWFTHFRIDGPQGPAFDGSWKPGDFEEMK